MTEQLVRAMAEAKSRPRVFISGNAVGYYGDRTDELLTEASSTADDFLARLCRPHVAGIVVIMGTTANLIGQAQHP